MEALKMKLIKAINVTDIHRTLRKDFTIEELKGVDLANIVVLSPTGREQKIFKTSSPVRFTIQFSSRVVQGVEIFNKAIAEKSPAEVAVKPEEPKVLAVPVSPKKKTRNPLTTLQKKQNDRINAKRELIRKREGLNPKELQNKRVLTFDQTCCWARSLGMIAKAKQLEYQIKVPLYEYYDRITGQGNGAIIAAAVAGRITMNDFVNWWVGEWMKAHQRTLGAGGKRLLKRFINSNEDGFDHKKAVKALKKLYLDGQVPLRMKDVGTELNITVMQADLNVTTHDSNKHGDMALWEVVEDSAITRMDYNSKKTIKGEAIFLGEVEKNDVLRMAIADNNDGLHMTSIGVPVRVTPERDKKLEKSGHGAMKVKRREASHFIHENNIEKTMQKLKQLGLNIEYLRLECDPIDSVLPNSTTEEAMRLGRESGSGKIDLPSWFVKTLQKRIA